MFSILDGVRAAILRESTFLLEVLARIEFELLLHTHTILESDPVDRLRAYCAWCIWNDRSFQSEFVRPETLDGVWDVEPVRQLIENPSALEEVERLFGPLPEGMEIDEREAKRRRFRQQDRERHKLKRIEAWLQDPDLAVWVERLRKVRRGTSFFALFGEDESSIAKRLESMSMRFAYMGYMKGSMFIHGSTMEGLFFINEESIAPRIVGSKESVSDLASQIGRGCNNSLVVLGALRSRLWSIEGSSNLQDPET